MPRTLQFRRYNTAQLANTTGANGEIIINTTTRVITVHDGVTPGGYTPTATAVDSFARTTANSATTLAQSAYNYANTASNNITIMTGVNVTQNTNITILQSVNTTQNTNITTATNLAQSAFNTANNANTRTVINGLGVSKLDFNTYGANSAYLTTTDNDSTALFMGAVSAELYANTDVSIRANTGGISQTWTFDTDGTLRFPNNTVQTGGSISRIELKALVANSATYAAFQAAIAAL